MLKFRGNLALASMTQLQFLQYDYNVVSSYQVKQVLQEDGHGDKEG